jgi:hypothetical protein
MSKISALTLGIDRTTNASAPSKLRQSMNVPLCASESPRHMTKS